MSKLHRRLVALLTIPILVLMSGCVRMKADYEILGDDEMRVAIDLGMLNGPDQPDEGVQGVEVEPADLCSQDTLINSNDLVSEEYREDGEDGYSGCRLTGTVKISDLKDSDTTLALNNGVWTFKMGNGGEGGDEANDADMFSDFRISVKFPGEVLTHSGASTVDGTTVTWTDPKDFVSAGGLEATAKNTGSLTWLWLTIGALVLVGAATAVVLVLRSRKKTPSPQGGPWQGGYGPQGPPQYGPGPGQQYPPQGQQFGQNQQYAPQGQQFGQGQQYPPQGQQFSQGQQYPPQGQQFGQGQQYPPQGQQFGQNQQYPPQVQSQPDRPVDLP